MASRNLRDRTQKANPRSGHVELTYLGIWGSPKLDRKDKKERLLKAGTVSKRRQLT